MRHGSLKWCGRGIAGTVNRSVAWGWNRFKTRSIEKSDGQAETGKTMDKFWRDDWIDEAIRYALAQEEDIAGTKTSN
ncbi:MAG: hypothetical protein KDJ54_17905 [Candidatus Competibacteraceae bacterium]|nr:hypothetical protein [Candidatus Competibacteraceae bacterium]